MRTGPSSAPVAPRAIVVGLAAVLSGACDRGSATSPTQSTPNTAPLNLAGTWTGTASDSTGAGRMSWTLTQTAAAVAGTVTLVDSATQLRGNGSVTGTVAGGALTFSVQIPAGGFDPPLATCATTATGSAEAASSSMVGSYSGTNTCSGAIAAGHFTLSRQ